LVILKSVFKLKSFNIYMVLIEEKEYENFKSE
jgi:hypothetical protein